jgi:single-strand DNA-binding protein
MNRVTLIGRVGNRPEIRFLSSGNAVANFRLSTVETFTNRSGEKTERTEWHRIVAWGNLALAIGDYQKGRRLAVEGKIQTREWTDKENRTNYTTEIIATSIIDLAERRDEPIRTAEREDGLSFGFPVSPPAENEELPF